jgi:hypothetical protein
MDNLALSPNFHEAALTNEKPTAILIRILNADSQGDHLIFLHGCRARPGMRIGHFVLHDSLISTSGRGSLMPNATTTIRFQTGQPHNTASCPFAQAVV